MYKHLSKETAKKMFLNSDERIHHIKKPRWIGYNKSQDILRKLDDLLKYPKQSRMPNMLLVGDTNNGKTVLVNKFREIHPPLENLDGESITLPVLYIQAPPSPDERGIYNAILTRLFEPYGKSEATDSKRDRVVSILHQIDLGMIMIDEIQHLLAGSYVKQRNALNALKYLGNELCVPIVGIGTSEAVRAIHTDPQLANRFTPQVLPKWEFNTEYLQLLASFEYLLPLAKASNLIEKNIAEAILSLSDGTIGEISTLLNQAAIYSIQNNIEKINLDCLYQCDYISPYDRKNIASTI